MKALVVDDDSTCRLVLEDILARLGEVDSCSDGTEAVSAARLALANGTPYDLICLDLLMPSMNGLEALQWIRREEECCGRPHAAKVIVTTSSEDQGNIEQAFGQLCDAYIVKPVDAGNFLDVMECVCDVDGLRGRVETKGAS